MRGGEGGEEGDGEEDEEEGGREEAGHGGFLFITIHSFVYLKN